MGIGTGKSVPVLTVDVINDEGHLITINKTEVLKYRKKGYLRKGEKPTEEVAETPVVNTTPPENKTDDIKIDELDEDGLAQLILDEDLDIDLTDYQSIEEQRNAVVESMEEKDEE